jgi:hypothetical protein
MKLYNKKKLRKFVDRHISRSIETRDAMCWEVLEEQRVVLVKVSGSEKLIRAHYPKNWSHTPFWLKPGNALRVRHRGGERQYLEVIGHGRTVPATVPGGTARPPIPSGEDKIMSGLRIVETDPPSLCMNVTEGAVRINGVLYYITDQGAVVAGDGAAPDLAGMAGQVCFSYPPPGGYFRLDCVEVGTDGEFHVISGEIQYEAAPLVPPESPNHAKIGCVLRHSGQFSSDLYGQMKDPSEWPPSIDGHWVEYGWE